MYLLKGMYKSTNVQKKIKSLFSHISLSRTKVHFCWFQLSPAFTDIRLRELCVTKFNLHQFNM